MINTGFNMNIHYDSSLTEVPDDPDSFYEGILHLEREALTENDPVNKGKLFSRIGVSYRVFGNNEQSEIILLKALELLDAVKNKTDHFIAELRLSQTFQKQGKFEDSINILKRLENISRENKELNNYTDVVYQHLGKVYFDMERFEEAMYKFKKAKTLREVKGDRELLSSTEFAITITAGKIKSLNL
ncbi:MAG: tetratricopeptide repeat protein [Ignavibacteria bacterium]|nr:tetratricopeptide repeat protein [Ignavibacteria bacterium]